MTPGARRALFELASDENCDLVQDGLSVWCGERRSTPRVVLELLRLTAISVSWKEGRATYYHLNDTGRSLLRRPELEEEIAAAYANRSGPFSIVNDRLKPL